MKCIKRKSPTPLALMAAVAAFALSIGPHPARAQWELGWGLFGGFNTVPSPTQFLNEQSLSRTGRGVQTRPSHNPYAGNPNTYFNRVRDNGLVPHYDVATAVAPAYRPSRQPSPAAAPAPAPQPAARPTLPLAGFFDATRRLVWPAESPVEGDLQEKRDRSDEASLAVLDETERNAAASLTTVALARQRLLDYGQPALQKVRQVQTLPIADSFHMFLLSLYEALGQAALPASHP
jgi:hypothetical protein